MGLSSIAEQLKESISIVQDDKRSALDKEEHAQLCVYRALSVHPALNAMRPPTQVLGDLDWYTELKSPLALLGGLFKKLGQNDHFRRTSNLGEQGRRARIMMLICWVIGHRLPQDKVRQFVSTTVGDALATFETGDHVDTLLQLHMVRKVLEQLAKMIRTRLPLPKERNPFYGEDFVADDEDKVVPRAELWAYGEEPGEGYTSSLLSSPTTLLRYPLTVYRQTKDMSLTSNIILLYSYALLNLGFSFHRQSCPCSRFNGSRAISGWGKKCSLDVTLIQRCSGMPIHLHSHISATS